MSSVWSWLSGRKRMKEECKKALRHTGQYRHSPGFLSKSQVIFSRNKQNYAFSTAHSGFVCAPETAKAISSDLIDERRRYVIHETRQSTETDQSLRTFENPNVKINREEYRPEQRHLNFDEHTDLRGHHYGAISDNLRDHQFFLHDNWYRRRAFEVAVGNNLPTDGQRRRPGAFQPIHKDSGNFCRVVNGHYDQHKLYCPRPVKDQFAYIFCGPPRLNTFCIPEDVALRHSMPVLQAGQRRYFTRPDKDGRDVISTYVPRIVGQRDVSAILFGEAEQGMLELKKPRPNKFSGNLYLDYRHTKERPYLRQIPSPMPNGLSKEKHQIYPLQVRQPQDEKTYFPGKPYHDSTVQPQKFVFEHDQKTQPFLDLTSGTKWSRHEEWGSSDKGSFNKRSPTSDFKMTSLGAGYNVSQLHNSDVRTTVKVTSKRSNMNSSGGSWTASRKLKARNEVHTTRISSNNNFTDNCTNNSSTDEISDEEVWNVLSQLDSITNQGSESDIHRELDIMFNSEGDILY